MKNKHAVELGRLGGRSKSAKKVAASRENGKKRLKRSQMPQVESTSHAIKNGLSRKEGIKEREIEATLTRLDQNTTTGGQSNENV